MIGYLRVNHFLSASTCHSLGSKDQLDEKEERYVCLTIIMLFILLLVE